MNEDIQGIIDGTHVLYSDDVVGEGIMQIIHEKLTEGSLTLENLDALLGKGLWSIGRVKNEIDYANIASWGSEGNAIAGPNHRVVVDLGPQYSPLNDDHVIKRTIVIKDDGSGLGIKEEIVPIDEPDGQDIEGWRG